MGSDGLYPRNVPTKDTTFVSFVVIRPSTTQSFPAPPPETPPPDHDARQSARPRHPPSSPVDGSPTNATEEPAVRARRCRRSPRAAPPLADERTGRQNRDCPAELRLQSGARARGARQSRSAD